MIGAAFRALSAIGEASGKVSNVAYSWDSTFAKWFPSYTNSVQVDVVGKRETPMRTVLHAALSVAFGVRGDIKGANRGIKIEVDHRNNTVSVGYGIDISGLLGMTLPILTDDKALALLFKTTGLDAIWLAIKDFGDYVALFKKAADGISAYGVPDIWNMANRDGHIEGGKPPRAYLVEGKTPAPARDMEGVVFLTKSPAANPQITPFPGTKSFEGYPASQPGGGLTADLATMVASALMDPGIRNFVPATDFPPKPGATELGVPR